MKKQELRELKARAQRLEALIDSFENDVAILHENGVDVTNSTEISERQNELQDELELVISDLLLVLDTSGNVSREEFEIDLPNTGRTPISGGSLPEPRFERPEGRGTPLWSGGGDASNSNGNTGGS